MSMHELEKIVEDLWELVKEKRVMKDVLEDTDYLKVSDVKNAIKKVEVCFLQHKQQLKDALEKLKQTRDKRYAETDDLSWTLHGAILGIGFVLGTHTLDTILETKGENLLKGVGKEGDK